jgi:hypothetical protein
VPDAALAAWFGAELFLRLPLAGDIRLNSFCGSRVANRADNRSLVWQHGIIFRGRLHLITPYLDAANVDPETKRVLDIALEMTRISLGLEDDFANGMIAKQIIEIAKTGERNPDLLCEGALKNLRENLYGD